MEKHVAEAKHDGVLRRKIAAVKATRTQTATGADRAWRIALARAASKEMNLALDVNALTMKPLSLAELLELPFSFALIAVLQGPAEGNGLMLLSSEVVAGLVEMQTLGRVGSQAIEPRKLTRTDAAMVAPLLDAALTEMDHELELDPDLVWAGGFRYASFLEDARPLGLLMEDFGYRLLTAEVSLGLGARQGNIYFVLPAKGRGVQPVLASKPNVADAPDQGSNHDFVSRIEASGCVLDAVLGHVRMPLDEVLALEVGTVLPLGRATIERLCLTALNGVNLAQGKLGQHRGMRAIRLSLPASIPQEAGATVPRTSGDLLPFATKVFPGVQPSRVPFDDQLPQVAAGLAQSG